MGKRERKQGLVLIQLRSGLLSHPLQVTAAAARAHGAGIVLVENLVALLQLDARVLTRDDYGAAGLAGTHLGAHDGRGLGPFVAIVEGGGGCGGGGHGGFVVEGGGGGGGLVAILGSGGGLVRGGCGGGG